VDLAVVGAGRVGTALAVLWRRAGHRILAVSGGAATAERAAEHLPGIPVLGNVDAARDAGVVLIATPDGAIAGVCEELARAGAVGPGVAVAHASGAIGLDALAPARSAGASALALHPLQTCPTVEAAIERIPGAAFAVTSATDEGFALGERLALEAGGRPFRLADEAKPLYHAAAVFASNYVVSSVWAATTLFRSIGIRNGAELLAPLVQASVSNVLGRGGPKAITGPVVRGDADVVKRHVKALREMDPTGRAVTDAYRYFARMTAALANVDPKAIEKATA
jgi:predicted short-subunit dehydrogenase-like oxidoreductase (DUF2520 family)